MTWMSPCSSGAVPTGFGTGVGVRPGGQDRAVCGSWLGPPKGRGARRMSAQGEGGPCRSGHVEQREPTARGLRPVDSGLGFLSVPRWSQAVLAARSGVPGTRTRNRPGGGRQRPPSRAPSSRPLLFIGNTLGAARALWWRLPAKGRRGHAFRHSQSRVFIRVSTTHRSHLPSTPTPRRSNPSGFQRAP